MLSGQKFATFDRVTCDGIAKMIICEHGADAFKQTLQDNFSNNLSALIHLEQLLLQIRN